MHRRTPPQKRGQSASPTDDATCAAQYSPFNGFLSLFRSQIDMVIDCRGGMIGNQLLLWFNVAVHTKGVLRVVLGLEFTKTIQFRCPRSRAFRLETVGCLYAIQCLEGCTDFTDPFLHSLSACQTIFLVIATFDDNLCMVCKA